MKNSILGIVILSVALFGCSEKKEAAGPSATPAPASTAAASTSTAADIAAGKVIAERDCKGCHGLEGGGAAPGIPHLAAQRERYLFASLKEYKDGKRHHAALRDLTGQMTESDMRQVAAYYASLPPVASAAAKDIQVPVPYQEGKALAAPCAKCHGEDGNSKTPGTPNLAGQQPHYLIMAIQEYHEGQRNDATMKSMLKASNKLDVEKLAMYFAAQRTDQRRRSRGGRTRDRDVRRLPRFARGEHRRRDTDAGGTGREISGQRNEGLPRRPQEFRHATLRRGPERKGHSKHRRLLFDPEIQGCRRNAYLGQGSGGQMRPLPRFGH
jgi:cytochrome c553